MGTTDQPTNKAQTKSSINVKLETRQPSLLSHPHTTINNDHENTLARSRVKQESKPAVPIDQSLGEEREKKEETPRNGDGDEEEMNEVGAAMSIRGCCCSFCSSCCC